MRRRRYPLSIHITSLFLILTTFVGAVLISISYRHSQELLLGTVREVSNEHRDKLESVFKQAVAPVITTLNVMAVSPFVNQQSSSTEKESWLASVDIIFKQNTNLVALFYGSEDGDFRIFRPLSTNKQRAENNAPAKATMMVSSTNLDGENFITYLDGAHQVISTVQSESKFNPTTRTWYRNAKPDGSIHLSEPYLFYFLKTNGITLSRRSADGKHVVGADFTLSSLSSQISDLAYSPQTRLALFDQHFNLLGQHQLDLTTSNLTFQANHDNTNNVTGAGKLSGSEQEQSFFNIPKREQMEALKSSVLGPLISDEEKFNLNLKNVEYNLNTWALTLTPVELTQSVTLYLAEATPHNELLSDLISMRDKQVAVAIGMLFICFGIVWLVANRLSQPLNTLMQLTDNIARFDFRRTHYPKSMIKEVANLAHSIELMEHTLHDLINLLRDTAGNQEFSILAKNIAHQSYLITKAETILLFTQSEEKDVFDTAANLAIIPFKADINDFIKHTPWLLCKLKSGETIHLNREDNVLNYYQDSIFNSDLYLFPLLNREKLLVGIVAIGYERPITKAQSDKHAFLRELLSFAEIAKDNIDQMQQQKDMLNAFIELIASAIDTKSPYTGGHCQRVPELTKWLTQATIDDDRYYPQFSLDNKQWEELMLAAWLHDCGKVTTPEYVVDKATKLETIYDRIHEVRMRFELLKQQAETDYWKAMANGGLQEEQLQTLGQTLSDLDEEFAFVAQCNLGGESMTQEQLERLDQIAKRQWKRTLDDQLGISWAEKERYNSWQKSSQSAGAKPDHSEQTLPVMEPLLADKPEHKIPWDNGFNPAELWQEEFVLKPGEVKYNQGELHNLKVNRGTLNEEERFMINDHIIQTFTMLNKLPYPPYLQNIPEIASGHHERIDGKGYPRGLSEDQLPLPSRAMAIADVFEALTSSDRPYKKGKLLSESLNIMTNMATSGHIDPKLYLLFLENKIYDKYAERFLELSQRCDIDETKHIEKVKEYIRSLF
ncbi:Metal-dependent phosphohydrolase [Vibrio chagasii]|uniref:HD domain-containing phosphohydrolase n=1 Tax=Vibrio TaxID=662 RepID=UPI000E3276D8|nr:HD domain-containing phosphohydrolase [Vibrio splendidus]CAH6797703.1 Metal-dependent phosphohydrolase [Vibrio chagasii]CAH6933843.1 Metal-dependent phosphohydrolase [Vibrio chagasii]CAH7110183.1 Metal-dependent phosphohydrolase [Vibrio chagasii]CAH7151815.1 Metal-dependent phosphohydrolase [Vibrio chagasii]CAH7422820.1 Metal-dependent phosphohydrolase [Vibrio chagasii]